MQGGVEEIPVLEAQSLLERKIAREPGNGRMRPRALDAPESRAAHFVTTADLLLQLAAGNGYGRRIASANCNTRTKKQGEAATELAPKEKG
jgi:hypothetical protein